LDEYEDMKDQLVVLTLDGLRAGVGLDKDHILRPSASASELVAVRVHQTIKVVAAGSVVMQSNLRIPISILVSKERGDEESIKIQRGCLAWRNGIRKWLCG
jgi:hypothetical protein